MRRSGWSRSSEYALVRSRSPVPERREPTLIQKKRDGSWFVRFRYREAIKDKPLGITTAVLPEGATPRPEDESATSSRRGAWRRGAWRRGVGVLLVPPCEIPIM